MAAEPLATSGQTVNPEETRITLHSEELNYLNREHAFPRMQLEYDEAEGFFAGLIRRLRRSLLGPYAARQVEFQANLVRCLNRLARAEEQKGARIEDTLESSLYTLERKLQGNLESSLGNIEAKLAGLERLERENQIKLEMLESVASGLERIIARMGQRPTSGQSVDEALSQPEAAESIDYRYLLLENRYRGSEDSVQNRLLPYVEVFRNARAPVLEVGCGRGELLELFRQNEINAYGIELDRAMVESCLEKGLKVELEDGARHLAGLSSQSLGGLIAVQVVEHLTPQQLTDFLSQAVRCLQPGARLVLETINTKSMVALCRNYFRDPTHQQPLHPETMRFIVEAAGLRVLDVVERSPFQPEVCLQPLPVEEYMTPRWQAVIELLNHNTAVLNDLLFGTQDYCIIAEAVG